MKVKVWQAILRESDRFGFEPVEPYWMDARRSTAVHEPHIPNVWWSEDVPFLVGFFTDVEAHCFTLTLERILGIRQSTVQDRSRSPFNELIELSDLSEVIAVARLGTFEWFHDLKLGIVLRNGISDDTRTQFGHLGKLEPPGEPPETCDLSERAEIRRLGADPHSRGAIAANELEMTWWGWRAALCIFSLPAMEPSDREWHRWLYIYAYYDPGRAHYWWNTGYFRISTFSEHDTAKLKSALFRYIEEPDAMLKRLWTLREADQPTDVILALSSVSMEDVRSVADLCEDGSITWKVYSDGIIRLSRH